MSIQANEIVGTAGRFAEGTMALASGTWHCLSHDLTVKVGRECAWCTQESMTEAQFEKWLAINSGKRIRIVKRH